MRGQGRLYRRKGTANWWLDYSIRGTRHLESSGTASKREALDLLRQRIGDRKSGKLVGSPDKVTFADLRAGLERHYEREGNVSLARAQQALKHLGEFFGSDTRALAITKPRVGAYLEQRLAAGAQRATVRYEIAVLNAAFSVAVEEEEVLTVRPMFKLPAVQNARVGFFEAGDVAALLLELPADVRAVVRFLSMTGWRKAEALGLTWDRVDWEGGVLRIGAASTKGGDARTFPFGQAADLKRLLEERWAEREGPCVFHRGGRPIQSFRRAWAGACKRAGLDGMLVHDLRRTAARAFRRAGVSEGEIMRLCGWKTRAMFDRYNIIDEADLAAAVAKRFALVPAANDTVAGQLGAPAASPPSVSSSATISAA